MALPDDYLEQIDSQYENLLPPPTIIKPVPLWTGKQLMSLIIPNQVNF